MFSSVVPSGAPQNVESLTLSSTSLILMWDELPSDQQNGPIIGYTVQVMRIDSVDTNETFTHNNSTTIIINELVPYTYYEWRVAAQTVAGTGPFSSTVIQQTFPDGIKHYIVIVYTADNTLILLYPQPQVNLRWMLEL